MNFTHSYSQLGDAFFEYSVPMAVSSPRLLLWNQALSTQLQITASLQNDSQLQAQYFSGSVLPPTASPIALAYCGHQFGHLNPQLGDGRAHLLGELIDTANQRVDVQLKGSGPTPYSRQGDGRCALGPAIREYLMSEAMYYLGVPTTRCLAVVATGEPVYRETIKPGAVVTRVAESHIRVGTFQFFAIRGDITSLTTLLDYAVDRHFPAINKADGNTALLFLSAVIERQITLVTQWLRVGFIHGVMNTDNTAISGETIDFGPCAMMGIYNPATVYSSIDTQGRYAFANQPNITLWNMTRLAECLLPLIDSDQDAAIAMVEPVLMQAGKTMVRQRYKMLANKLGLSDIDDKNTGFIDALLLIMQENQLDYTNTFISLTQSIKSGNNLDKLHPAIVSWLPSWRQQLAAAGQNDTEAAALMAQNNPVVIPRNHHIEAVLTQCEESGSAQPAEDFLSVLRSPYQTLAATANYQDLPEDNDKGYRTFCGT